MGVDHSVITQPKDLPVFLSVSVGDIVVCWDHPEIVGSESSAWFMAAVLYIEGSARDPKAPSLFQVINVDTGAISFVNADCVEKVLMPSNRYSTAFSSIDAFYSTN